MITRVWHPAIPRRHCLTKALHVRTRDAEKNLHTEERRTQAALLARLPMTHRYNVVLLCGKSTLCRGVIQGAGRSPTERDGIVLA